MKVGDLVPDFEATLEDGRSVRVSELLEDGPVVLFFYPKAFTPGCTAESCHFCDLAAEFAALGGQRIGVSRDSVDTQRRFREEHDFDYPLISDADGSIAKIFGASRLIPTWNKRQTFVINTDGTVFGIIASEVNMSKHADEALELLRERNAQAA